MRKIIVATLFSLTFLSGCNDPKNEVPASITQGNFSAKAETLSTQNEGDIKADLTVVNKIINTSNTKAVELAQQLMEASKKGDSKSLLGIFKESKALLESTNNSLLSLNLKSSELQKIRTDIYQGNIISIKFYDLYAKENKSEDEKKELALLQKQIISLQQLVGKQLDQLNTQYKQQ